MKKLYLACAASILAAAPFTLAHAEETMTVQIPYPFVAHGVAMPAGAYTIHEMQPSRAMLLRGPGGHSVLIMGQPGFTGGAPAELVFRGVDGHMVLSTAYDDAGSAGIIPATR